jgi:hypothetical protein
LYHYLAFSAGFSASLAFINLLLISRKNSS